MFVNAAAASLSCPISSFLRDSVKAVHVGNAPTVGHCASKGCVASLEEEDDEEEVGVDFCWGRGRRCWRRGIPSDEDGDFSYRHERREDLSNIVIWKFSHCQLCSLLVT